MNRERIEIEIKECKERIQGYEDTLAVMPSDTFLGVLCVKAYLKKERKRLVKLYEDLNNA
jgi:hypothetical protein